MVGQGAPLGEVPAEFPWLLPAEPDEFELDEPELDEPELEDPALGAEEPVVPDVVGPQGAPLGLVPGVFGLLGAVEGCVFPLELEGFVGFEPGVVDGELGDVEPVGGVAEPVGGVVAVPAGGVALLGDWLCAAPELPAGADPPAGALCATTQVAQKRSTERKESFLADIGNASFDL